MVVCRKNTLRPYPRCSTSPSTFSFTTGPLEEAQPISATYVLLRTPSTVFCLSVATHGSIAEFGVKVTYAMPACHPHFGIPFTPGRANHTPEFTGKARSPRAHEEAWKSATGMAAVGMRFLGDGEYAKAVGGFVLVLDCDQELVRCS